MPSNYGVYEFWIALIACAGGVISTSEWISNNRQLKDDGLFSWAVFGTRGAILRPRIVERSLDALVSRRPFLCLLALRLVALVGLPIGMRFGHGSVVALAVICFTSLLMHFRCPFGMDGSDQMQTQIFGALLIGEWSGSAVGHQAALWFIAAQACLSYVTSGMAKAISPHWRDSKVLFAIFNTRTYGYAPAARWLLNNPGPTRALGAGAVFMECIFPIAILVGFPGCLLFIAWGVAFHLMNAVVMGLNSFLWSFAATYPAVIFCAISVATILRSPLSLARLLHFPY